MYVYIDITLSLSLSLTLSLSLSLSLSIYRSIDRSIYLSIYHLPVHLLKKARDDPSNLLLHVAAQIQGQKHLTSLAIICLFWDTVRRHTLDSSLGASIFFAKQNI